MPALLESLTSLLTDHDAAALLAPQIGADEQAAASAIEPSLARILDGLAELVSSQLAEEVTRDPSDDPGSSTSSGWDEAAAALSAVVDRHDLPGHGDRLDRFLSGGQAGSGNDILDQIFGAERGLVVIGLASGLGLAPSLIGRLLPLLAPVVAQELVEHRSEVAEGTELVDLLLDEREAISAAGLLDGTVFDETGMAGGGVVETAEVEVESEVVAEPSQQPVPVPVGASVEEEIRVDGEDGAGGGPTDGISVSPTPDVGAGDDAADEEEADPLEADPPEGEADGEVDGDRPSVAPPGDGDVELLPPPTRADRRSGTPVRMAALAWLGWAAGAIILVLLLAGLLSTCTTEAQRGSTSTSLIALGPSDPAAPDASVPPGDLESPEVTTGPGGTPSSAGSGPESSASDGAIATGRPTLLDGSSILLPDGPAPTTDEAAGEAAIGEAEAGEAAASGGAEVPLVSPPIESGLAAAVEAVLAGTGITGEVTADGVALIGTVDSEEARLEAEARVAMLLGVDAVDNRIVVVEPADVEFEPAQEPVGPSGSTLNDLLSLAPVTFAESSFDLTPEGQAVLDQVVTFLLDNAEVAIEIGGHTDDDGDEQPNLELSHQRADAVLAHLVAAGVAGQRLSAVGYGESDPAVPNDSLDNKAINRRIEFTIR